MKVIKPQYVSVLTRPYEVRRELRLGVSVLLFVSLGEERALLPEVALWQVAAKEMGGAPVLDAGIPKSRCEYLLAGSAYPVLAEHHRQCAVQATVAGRQKKLLVTGDRYWLNADGGMSEAQAFETIPLDWRRAFGGPEHPPNSAGRGLAAEDVDGELVVRLPNIEYPDDLVESPGSQPRPAGFGALEVTVPERAQKAGTYDARWLREGFPGFAQDIDWTFFNVAPQDQQFDRDAFALDATYEFRNLHPTQGVVEGRLPNLRARCFVSRAGKAPDVLEELSLRLGTVWFFPAAERAVLIFHGATEVSEDDGSDITHLLAAAEDATLESRKADYYTEVLKRRLDPEKGALLALKDEELCPIELAPREPSGEASSAKGVLEQRLAKRRDREIAAARAEVASYGLDPDEHGPRMVQEEPAPTPDEMPAFLEKVMADAERQKREQLEHAERVDRENEALFTTLGLDYDVVKAEMAHKPSGPPTFTAEGQVAELRKVIESMAAQGLPTDHVQEIVDDPVHQETWRFAEEKVREGYRLGAHLQHPAPAQTEEVSARARVLIQEQRTGGAAGADYTGVDLSGLDLSGAVLEGIFMESAKLAGAKLRGARLEGAVLARADLRDADLEGADLRGANLGSAELAGANLSQTQLESAILAGAHLERTRFDGASMAGADLSGAHFEATSFARTSIAETTFRECELRSVDFSGARLERCNFLQVDLSEARFCNADLSGAVLLGCKVVGADFTRARLVNLRGVDRTSFERATFLEADLRSANLRECLLQGARLELAKLDGADLSGANIEGANLYRSSAIGARFTRANLTRARLVAANLMDASLASARLDGADLTGAHLYGTDLGRVHLDEGTRFEPATLLHARIHPVREGGRSPLPESGAG